MRSVLALFGLCLGHALVPATASASEAIPAPPDGPRAVKIGTRGGLDVYLFREPRPHVLPVLPAVVIVLDAGVPVPEELRTRGEPLGGRSWRIRSSDPVGDAERWSARPGVSAADPDLLLPIRGRQFDDPDYGGQWYLEDLHMEDLFEVSLGDSSTRAAVIDSAIEIAHPDLADGVDAPYDAVDEDLDPSPNLGEYCDPGVEEYCDVHGTAVSGIVAARANNGVAIVGLCPECTLVPIRMLAERDTSLAVNVAAFEHAIAQDAAVINNSWGFTTSIPVPKVLADVIYRAFTETRGGLGSLVVFAAGNDDRVIVDDEMEALPEVLCVSAVDSYGRPTAYTNQGETVDVSAPSATVTLSVNGGTTETFGGTSAAAPVVSGLAGWIASVAPTLSAQDMMDLLVSTARQSPLITPDERGHHDVYGYGIVDPPAILARLFPGEDAGPDAGPDAGGDAAPDAGGAPVLRAAGSGLACRASPGHAGTWLPWLLAVLPLVRRRARPVG